MVTKREYSRIRGIVDDAKWSNIRFMQPSEERLQIELVDGDILISAPSDHMPKVEEVLSSSYWPEGNSSREMLPTRSFLHPHHEFSTVKISPIGRQFTRADIKKLVEELGHNGIIDTQFGGVTRAKQALRVAHSFDTYAPRVEAPTRHLFCDKALLAQRPSGEIEQISVYPDTVQNNSSVSIKMVSERGVDKERFNSLIKELTKKFPTARVHDNSVGGRQGSGNNLTDTIGISLGSDKVLLEDMKKILQVLADAKAISPVEYEEAAQVFGIDLHGELVKGTVIDR